MRVRDLNISSAGHRNQQKVAVTVVSVGQKHHVGVAQHTLSICGQYAIADFHVGDGYV